jgi:hypothetical protein
MRTTMQVLLWISVAAVIVVVGVFGLAVESAKPSQSAETRLSRPLRIHVINLDRAVDRWTHLSGHLAERGFPSVSRMSAVDRPDDGGLGCYLSHLSILNTLSSASPSMWDIILEDDFQFEEGVTHDRLRQELEHMDTWSKGQWDVCILGHYVYDWEPWLGDTYYRIWAGTTLSGYIVHPNRRQQLHTYLRQHLPAPGIRCRGPKEIDQIIQNLFNTWIVVCRKQPWGYQRATVSTIYPGAGQVVDNRWTQLSDTLFQGQNGQVFPLRTREKSTN